MTSSTLERRDPVVAIQTSSHWHALAATSLGIMFDALDASIYVIAMHPALAELLHTKDDAQIGFFGSLILATFMVGWALGGVIFGALADRFGRTKAMIGSILLYAVCTGLCALSHTWQELAIYRFFVGCGIGGEISIGVVVLAESWKGKGRIAATSFMEAAFCVGYMLTSLINVGVGTNSWRLLFVAGIVPALLTLYIRSRLREPESFQRMQLENAGKEKTCPIAGCVESFRTIFNDANRANTIRTAVSAAAAIVGYWAALSWVPAWINQLTGTEAVMERSTAAMVMNIAGLVAAFAVVPLIAQFGRIRALKMSFAGCLISGVLMFSTVHEYGLALNLWLAAIGFFSLLPFGILCVYIPEVFATRIVGTACGFAWSAGRIMAAATVLGGGYLVTLCGGQYAAAGAAAAAVYAMGWVIAIFMPETNGEVAGGSVVSERRLDRETCEQVAA
jgi:MFS family permease